MRRTTSNESVPTGGSDAPAGKVSVPRAVVEKVLAGYRCPITLNLLVDPVVAQDGHIYERDALEHWFQAKKTSPVLGAPMGTCVTPVLAVRETIDELVAKAGLLDDGESHQFFLVRGQKRALRATEPGPDLAGAELDLERARKFARTEDERACVDIQAEAVAWLRGGMGLFSRVGNGPGAELPGGGLAFEWAARVCAVAQSLATKQLGGLLLLGCWRELQLGTRVQVVGAVEEVKARCSSPAPGASQAVKWNDDMAQLVGKPCTVVKNIQSTKSYSLRLMEGSDASFLFPYNTVALLPDAA